MKNSRLLILLTLGIFAIIFILISITNHYCFHTSALDYGMFNQALYSYAHLEHAHFTQSIDGAEVDYLCDHFSPIIIVLSPFYWVFGSYALLVVQLFSLLIGAYFLYRYSILRGINENQSVLFSIYFLSIWGVYAALSYDFHTNVISTALIPVLVFTFYKRRWIALCVITLIALMCKENSGILIFSLFVVLALENWRSVFSRNIALIFSAFSLLWVFIAVLWVMPSMCEGRPANVEGFYQGFGSNFREAFMNMISSPKRIIQLFVQDGNGELAKSKLTTYWWLLFSGGVFILLSPRFLFMLIPVLAQKFLSSNSGLWDIHGQYSIEFVPIIVLASLSFLLKRKDSQWARIMIVISVSLALLMTYRGVITKNDKANIFNERHYESLFSHQQFKEALSFIPLETDICSTTPLTPHLTGRERIFLFPNWKEAELILVHKKPIETYPLLKRDYERSIDELKLSPNMKLVFENGEFIVFRNLNYNER